MQRYIILFLLFLAISCTSCSKANESNQKEEPTPTPMLTHSTVVQETKQLRSTSIPFQSEKIVIEDLAEDIESDAIYVDDSVIYYTVETKKEDQDWTCYYRYNRELKQSELLYSKIFSQYTMMEAIYENQLLLCEVMQDDKSSQLVWNIFLVHEGEQRSLYMNKCTILPKLKLIENQLIISYENVSSKDEGIFETPLIKIDLDTYEVTQIVSTSYSITEEGFHNGYVLADMGGDSTGMIYGIVHLEKENVSLDETGTVQLFSYDFNEKKSTPLPVELERKPICLFGNEEVFLSNDYAGIAPLADVGNLYLKTSSGYQKYNIPKISSGYDFIDVIRLENGLLMCSSYSFYTVIDLQNLTYSQQEVNGAAS